MKTESESLLGLPVNSSSDSEQSEWENVDLNRTIFYELDDTPTYANQNSNSNIGTDSN